MKRETILAKPLITLIGSPAWVERAVNLLHQNGFSTRHYDCPHPSPSSLIDDLLDHYPVLLLGDSADPHWERHIHTLRTEQSTRRIPVLLVLSEPISEHRALDAGATACLQAENLDTQLIALVQQHARVLSPDQLDALVCRCRDPLPPLAQLGVKRFNAGAYHSQHDAFEELWMEETGPIRELYRAVLQVGVAYYHISRGNHAGGLKMLRRTVQWFALLPDECQGIDIRQLHEDADRVRAILQAMNPTDIASFDRALFRPVPFLHDQPED